MRFVAAAALLAACVTTPLAAQPVTEVIVLGVAHSAMLAAESYQPAVFRAYIERVKPDAICIERAPEEFARGSHYEFTYEIQDIAVPYAREHGIPLCAFDWLPAVEDQMLAFGVNLEEPPFLRGADSYADFITYTDSADLRRDLFYAESADERERNRAWYGSMPEKPRGDFARRLFLYRTFMQAMRIARTAAQYPDGRVLVLVGSMHKDDIEQILSAQPGVRIVSPTSAGAPSAADVARHVITRDLHAIATFNLLGAQSAAVVDARWLGRIVERLSVELPGPESDLLATRHAVLHTGLSAADAVARFRRIAADPAAARPFSWTGVRDRRRVDTFADPFGNLTIAERAALESTRELLRAGNRAAATAARDRLAASMAPLKAAQFNAYWQRWIGRR